jgi:hypothetical protein
VTYSIFCNDAPFPVECDSMPAAISTACTLMNGGADVYQIKGSNGFVMERGDIEIECLRRREESRRSRI